MKSGLEKKPKDFLFFTFVGIGQLAFSCVLSDLPVMLSLKALWMNSRLFFKIFKV